MSNEKICIVGMGYIGLPTAVMFATHGKRVHGVDVDERKIELLQRGEVPIEEPQLKEKLTTAIERRQFTVSNRPVESDVFILSVPSPITGEKKPDFSYIQAAARSIVPYLKEGDLVVLESTVPPRTVVDVVVPELERSHLTIGEQLFVSHSPERVIPGKVFEELISNDRIIGGINEESALRTVQLYETFVKGKMHVTDATTAELVKVMENTYRDVNIALANELAKVSASIGVDVWEAIQLANYHPRVNIHQPGPGVGGHCIAVDPWFLIDLDTVNTPLIRVARDTNDQMPQYTANLTHYIVNEASKVEGAHKVAVFGLAFKGDIDDMRESPSLDVVHYMTQHELDVASYDPYITDNLIPSQLQSMEEAVREASAIVILTNHTAFRSLPIEELGALMRHRIVIDTKNCIDRTQWEEAGFAVHTLGNSKAQR